MTEQQTVTTDEDVAKTLADYERIVQATGEWNGREATEFTNDGVTWSPVWVKTEAHPTPLAARSRVHRVGVLYPAEEVVLWDEAFPAENPDWQKVWTERPRVLFGAFTARRALKAAFREALRDRREPDDLPDARDAAPVPEPRDWDLEIATAATVDELKGVWSDARTARARTGPREVAYNARLTELAATAWEPPAMPFHTEPKPAAPTPHPPTVELRPATAPRPRIPAQHRPRNPEMAAALAAAVSDAETHGRPVTRTVRRAARAGGKP
ncbi:hypothetical protein B0I12_002248 [Microbacterium hydrothermale]|uniref:hypothetical protein n=1 Tax=Microbacterium hydrothermale TaxID=857427 RepID=UPI002227E006|nr:hypothetical protein [Microbacterium hydrothermale]MCW2165093.1 hypothetical protein [Microbacterium hydrothermale]